MNAHAPQPEAGYNFAYLDEGTKRMIRRAILKAIAIPGYQVPFAAREMPMPYGWGTGGVQVTAAILGASDVLKVIDQGADDTTNAVSIRRFFSATAGIATTTRDGGGQRDPDPPPHPGGAAPRGPGPRLPGADPGAAALPRAARDRDAPAARARRIRPDARQALRGHRLPRPHRHHLRLPGGGRGPLRHGPVADAEVRQSEDGRLPGAPALRGGPREADLRGAALHAGAQASTSRTTPSGSRASTAPAPSAGPKTSTSTRSSSTMPAAGCSCAPTPIIARAGASAGSGRRLPLPPLRGRVGFSSAKVGRGERPFRMRRAPLPT